MKKISILECELSISNTTETVDLVRAAVHQNVFLQYGDMNVATLVNMRGDAEIKRFFEACDIVNIDGMGIVFAARMLGHPVSERVAGVDLFDALMSMSSREMFSVFLLGATDDVVESTAKRVLERHTGLRIAGIHNGYFWNDEVSVVEKIRTSGAQLLFVAITSPKKEYFINRWRSQLGVNFVMGVGGTFDVVSGKVKRAPKWMQRTGLEWLYRVFQEPRRMWRRYLVTNSKFAYILLKDVYRSQRERARLRSDLGS